MSAWTLCNSLGVILLIGEATGYAAGTGMPNPVPSPNGRTTITAQKMTVRNQENKAVFEGSVVLTKGVLVVHSDVMVVLFKPSEQKETSPPSKPRSGAEELPTVSNRAVRMIEATGRVTIEKVEGRATCRKAVYFEDEQKIVLTGDPVAWQRGTRVSGRKITMFLADDRSVVEGESRVMIEPEGGERR